MQHSKTISGNSPTSNPLTLQLKATLVTGGLRHLLGAQGISEKNGCREPLANLYDLSKSTAIFGLFIAVGRVRLGSIGKKEKLGCLFH